MQLLKLKKKKADRLGAVICAYNLRTFKTQVRDFWAFKDSLDYRVDPILEEQCRIRNLAQLEGCLPSMHKALGLNPVSWFMPVISALGR